MKILFLTFFIITNAVFSQNDEERSITQFLDKWHYAAAHANFNDYFNCMDDESIFIGTDATENWNKKAFMSYAKPFFDKGKAWTFTSLQRHIYFSNDKNTVWFDELLNSSMKICRGSGVLIKTETGWKIKHYVLSMTVPNDNVSDVIKVKAPIEDALITKLKINGK